jgi:formylglycine-generating enzyme required for sulfatase activity
MPMPAFVRGHFTALLHGLAVVALGLAAHPAGAAAFKPGQVFRDCPDCPEMVAIPPGSFVMGSTEEERRKFNVPALFDKMESPRHAVTITQPYAVGRFSITMEQWDACVADGGCGGYRPDDGGFGRGRRPVINVDWADAQTYVYWLSRKTGLGYRLLSEAEWEYSARGGTTTTFFFGSTVSDANANYGSHRKGTLPVGNFPPNGFGLYDMAGNTAQWVEDCYHDSYVGAPTDGSAWLSGECVNRNVRGGAWSLDDWCLRAAQRIGDPPGSRNTHLGFRIARSLP